MTDQQKKAVEEAATAFVKEHAATIPFGQDSAVKADFRSGAEEVISNSEKYGLIEISKVLQGLGLKGGDL